MNAKELALKSIEDAGYQISQCIAGLSAELAETKVAPTALSPLETVAHLSEVYVAWVKKTKGEAHEWGTYRAADSSWEGVQADYLETRAAALERFAEVGDDELVSAMDFLAGHDYYHVGQLVLIRLSVEPEWNSYAIYKH